MKCIKNIIIASTLALSTILPFGNAYALNGEITNLVSYVNGTNIHSEGVASGGTLAVSIKVFDASGNTLIAGPETTDVDEASRFSYDMTGSFDPSKTYKVCAADFDGGGEWECQNTVKIINYVELTVKPPKIGETVTVTNTSQDKLPAVSTSDSNYEIVLKAWDKDGTATELFEGTFEVDKDYFAFIDLMPKAGYIFGSDPTVKIKGGGTIKAKSVWPDGEGMGIIVKIKANETGEIEVVADTGVAPKINDTKEIATRNISLGVSAAISASLLYGAHLIIKKKSNRK